MKSIFRQGSAVFWSPKGARGTLDIEVSDTGIGISPAKLQTIFDPFAQFGDARSGKIYRGTGLGLPICRRLVESIGGTLTAESVVNRGSVFTVIIPDVEVVGLDEPVAASADAGALGEAMRVVIVDDVPVNRLVLQRHVEQAGMPKESVSGHLSAADALSELDKCDADTYAHTVVFTDMWMPKMTGEAFVREIRGLDARFGHHLPVVAVTADGDVSGTFDIGLFDGLLTKPVTGEGVCAMLERMAGLCVGNAART